MLSIIIVNYKTEERTIDFINSELSKIITPNIVVIVNNSATEQSNKILVDKLNAELVTDINALPDHNKKKFIISNYDNLGFARANNLGVKFAVKHFCITHILFSNNDIRLIDTNVVELLIDKIECQNNIGLIGPKVIGVTGKCQSPEPYIPFWNRYFWMYWLTPFLSISKKNKIFNLDYSQKATEGVHYKIMGSFFLMKSSDFINCGMMDPNTFLYAEEIILSERLAAIGKCVYYYPRVTVFHEHGNTISKYINTQKRIILQSRSEFYYYSKYRKVSLISILIGKASIKLVLLLKNKQIN